MYATHNSCLYWKNGISDLAMSSTCTQGQLCTANPISRFAQCCPNFILALAFVSHHNRNLAKARVYRNEFFHMAFTTEAFLEVAKEHWSE